MDTSSERLDEIIGRLAALERKVDWVAARVAPDEVGARRVPVPAPSHPTPAPRPQSDPGRSAGESSSRPSTPASASPNASGTQTAPRAVGKPRTPALSTYPPSRPAPLSPGASTPNAPTGVPRIKLDAPTGNDPLATRSPRPQPQRSQEGNVGRYVLSGAAAFLIVSAAVSLIALVWDRIPDVVKVGTLGVIAVIMVASGTFLVYRRQRQRVAAATLTGTGGALGFVAVIGAAMIAGLPSIAAFVLMVAWAFVLLLVSCATRQFFTAVVSMLGAMVTVASPRRRWPAIRSRRR
ncbi:DUF2157 domain-containing protein [Actinomyces ruminis]|uniref:DUF2157 domain-containing protein n=1 Tax=Actinomyces ruminis TaxID=1937003 RepID=A0ABX4M973_9ACTO|nr:DUF2157 domain-containing protein [Actinomyces ruminis]PHP51992.1 DUF2157 domain-containing protein [Actinomyces ruminis]